MISAPANSIVLTQPSDTEAAGAALAEAFLRVRLDQTNGAFVIFLHGQLGAGKTTFARGFLRGLGHKGAVKSPTYALVEPYTFGAATLPPLETLSATGACSPHRDVNVYHLDLYRLNNPEELEMLGIRDFVADPLAACLIEWPEQGEGMLAAPDLALYLEPLTNGRRLTAEAGSQLGELLLHRHHHAAD